MLFPCSRTHFLPLTHSYSSFKIHFKSHFCQTTASSQCFICLASVFVVATLLSSSWTRLSKIFLLCPQAHGSNHSNFPLYCNCWCTGNYEQWACQGMRRFSVHGWALHSSSPFLSPSPFTTSILLPSFPSFLLHFLPSLLKCQCVQFRCLWSKDQRTSYLITMMQTSKV